MESRGASNTRIMLGLAVVYLVWGSTYLGIKVAIESMPPLLMASARFLSAGALLYAWTVYRASRSRTRERGRSGHRELRATRGREWRAVAISGLLMLVGGNGAVTIAEQHIDSGVAALLVATVPLWMALPAWALQGERLRRGAVVGLVVGFVGVGLLVNPSGEGTQVGPALLVMGGALSWAAGSLYVRRAPLPAAPLRATSMQMLAGGAVFAALGVAGGELGRVDLAAVTGRSLVALAYLSLFGSIVAYSAYTWLLRVTAPATVSTYAYVNPVVAVILGALLLGEPVTTGMLASGGLIVAGVALIVTARTKPAPPPAAPAVAGSMDRPAAAASPGGTPPAQPCTTP